MTATPVSKDGKAIVEGNNLLTVREFDAPRELVWAAWTQPQHVANWWGPRGFTTTNKSMDVRPGGEWQLVMHGPDGRDYANRIAYIEVQAPERLVFKHMGDLAGERPIEFQHSVTFDDLGDGRTRVTLLAQFASAEDLQHVVKNYHADEGAAQTMARLGEYLLLQKARSGATPTEGVRDREITLTRILNAPRDMVWAALTEPRHLMQWWGPHAFTCPHAEVDLRPGGRMVLTMRGHNGVDIPCEGRVEEVRPPELFVFSTSVPGLLKGLNTITLTEQESKTVMKLVARAQALENQAIPMLAGMEMGWSQSLEKLADHLSKA